MYPVPSLCVPACAGMTEGWRGNDGGWRRNDGGGSAGMTEGVLAGMTGSLTLTLFHRGRGDLTAI